MNLEKIFNTYNIDLTQNGQFRHVVDVLEDMYLKLNLKEYQKLIETISEYEKTDGLIFDIARNKPYE